MLGQQIVENTGPECTPHPRPQPNTRRNPIRLQQPEGHAPQHRRMGKLHRNHRVSVFLFSVKYFAEISSLFLQIIVPRFTCTVNLFSILHVKLLFFSQYFDEFHSFSRVYLFRCHKDSMQKKCK